jgi:hypothetical protein
LTAAAAQKMRADIRAEQKADWDYWANRVMLALALIGSIFGGCVFQKVGLMCQNWYSVIGQLLDVIGFLTIAVEWSHEYKRDHESASASFNEPMSSKRRNCRARNMKIRVATLITGACIRSYFSGNGVGGVRCSSLGRRS